jgi:hypothetical protein
LDLKRNSNRTLTRNVAAALDFEPQFLKNIGAQENSQACVEKN